MDDFALYGDVYGTLLVDAETRLPIELWAGRDAEQLAAWMRTHPGVEVVCRDGSLVYRRASPTAPRTRCRSATAFTCGRGCQKDRGYRRRPPRLPSRRGARGRARTGNVSSEPRGTVRPGRPALDATRSGCSRRFTR